MGLLVDGFAGGGGASLGIEWATGRSVDVAINHDAEALAMHQANHPSARHFNSNIWRVDPLDATGGKPVDLAWFSPDCKHHSKAKGGRPLNKSIRDLAWVVVMWAKRARPAVIFLENVEEFADWGPLLDDGRPCPERRGLTFRRFVRSLRNEGYKVEWKELRACDYGSPTIRKRLFMIARRDGRPIVWPAPTHGKGLVPYITAADIIDWSVPCHSIFLTREEGRRVGVNRPLAENTMARIAKGVQRYVMDAADPFIVGVAHGDSRGRREYGMDEPTRTHTQTGHQALVMPFLAQHNGADAPRPGHPVDTPLSTVTATGRQQSVVSAHLVKHNFGSKPCQDAAEPLHTVTTQGNRFGVVGAFLAQHNTGMVGHDARAPVSTITGKGCHQQVVTGHMLNLKGSDRRASGYDEPVRTVTAGGGHVAEVRAFLMKYYGTAIGQTMRDPAHTIRTRDNLALVMVQGEPYTLVDIGMRMLTARELYRAQGFPDSYIIEGLSVDGHPVTKTAQIRMCGNSVCPQVAFAIVRANVGAVGVDFNEGMVA